MDMQENVKVMMDKVAVLKNVVGKYMMRNFKDMPLTGDQSRLLFVIKNMVILKKKWHNVFIFLMQHFQ